MTLCTLSPEVYRWQHDGGWRTGRLVCVCGMEMTWGGLVQVHDALAESPGLFFIPWAQLEPYERGE